MGVMKRIWMEAMELWAEMQMRGNKMIPSLRGKVYNFQNKE